MASDGASLISTTKCDQIPNNLCYEFGQSDSDVQLNRPHKPFSFHTLVSWSVRPCQSRSPLILVPKGSYPRGAPNSHERCAMTLRITLNIKKTLGITTLNIDIHFYANFSSFSQHKCLRFPPFLIRPLGF